MYDDNDSFLFNKGKMPKLEKLVFNMSHTFRFNGSEYENSTNLTQHSDESDSLSMLGNATLLETENFIPTLNKSNIWETSFGVNINANEDKVK